MKSEEERLLDLIKELKDSEARHRLQTQYWAPWTPTSPGPYPWQVEFHNAGAKYRQRALLAANRVGKSLAGGAEAAMHLTGIYPPWFQGRRFDGPVSSICGSLSFKMIRDATQCSLFGQVDREHEVRDLPGTGWIPKNDIGDFGFKQCGVCNVVDYCRVKHHAPDGRHDGWSTVNFTTYEQGAEQFQATEQHFIWLDEEPQDLQVYTECLMRVMTTRGLVFITRTPLYGMSEIVLKFVREEPGTWMKKVGWKDAPHITPEMIEEELKNCAPHERAARSEGEPLLGAGAVYQVSPDEYVIEPVKLQPHWARITGHDFGIDHPAATIGIAHDRDSDTVYVYAERRVRGETPVYHAAGLNALGKWIPVSWPHDGMQVGKADGIPLAEHYRTHGANMLPTSACYDDEKLGAQAREPITGEILERMRTGRLKVFSTCPELLMELRMLHRDEKAKIVPVRDDLESALRYAIMMVRYAITPAEGDPNRTRPTTTAIEYDPFSCLNVA